MLNFIYNWGNGEKKNCWSGIPYGIITSLSKRIKVESINLENKKTEKIYIKVINKFNKITKTTDFNYHNEIIGENKINNLNLDKNDPCFTFLEYNTKYMKDTYCYQDCSVNYCLDLWENNSELKKYSPLASKIRFFIKKKRLKNVNEFYKNCRGIFTMSKWLAKYMVEVSKIDKDKVHYAGAGCNIDVNLIDDSKKQGNKFLFVGKDWKRKNGPLVVEAFKKLREFDNSVELYIAGPINQPKETIGVEGLNFLGRRSYDDLVKYYNICDYFVMPSKFEAFGIVFVEALIFGLPCIVRNAYAMPEIIENDVNGYILENESSDSLFELMKLMIKNNKRISNKVKSDRNYYIKEYSWDNVANRIIKVMENDGYKLEK